MVDNIVGDTQELVDSATDSAGALGLLGVAIKNTQSMFSEFVDSFGNIGNVLKGTSLATREMANSAQILSTAIFKSTEAFKGFSGAKGAFQSMSDPIDSMIVATEKAATATYTALGKKVPDSIQKSIDKMKEMSTTMGGAQNMQNAYIQMMMASGQATQLFTAGGADLSKLGGILKNTSDVVKNMQKDFSITQQAAEEFYQGIGQIPGALDKVTTEFGGAVAGMTPMTAAIRVAHGAGMQLGEALKQQTEAYNQFGKAGDDATEFMARQGELAQQLHVPVQKATGYLDEMADKFKYLGDNTKGASQVMMEMFDRFRASGVGVDPAIAQIKEMTGAMSNLTVAQKAFISAQSGGPGGLMGAMQIEKQLRDPSGKGAAEVMKKAQDAMMKQFGGRVVTLDEAAKSPAAAVQFQRERALLQSGAFGIGKGTSDEQATNLLNALAKPETGKSPAAAKEAIEKLAQQGKSYEEVNKTLLTGISADMRSLKEKGGLELLAYTKHIAGMSNEQGKKLLHEEEARAIAETAETTKASETGVDMSAKTTSNDIRGIYDRIGSGLTSAVKSYAGQPGGELTTSPTATEESSAQMAERIRILNQLRAAGRTTETVPLTDAAKGVFSHTSAQHVQMAAHAATAAAGKHGTTSTSTTSSQSRPTTESGKQPVTVIANVYVDGKLVQRTTSHQVMQDLGNHQSNPGNH